MELLNYLYEIYGYGNPIILKNIRIGRKSKTAIREEFYRAYKRGDLNRVAPGVYSLTNKTNEISSVVTFEKIIRDKFLYKENIINEYSDLFVNGYYSGLTFLNQIGLSTQVPAILEVTTNNTSSNKRIYSALGLSAILRKPKTEITMGNYKILQFLDMFHFVSLNEIKDKANNKLLRQYIVNNGLTKALFLKYINFYGFETIKKITEGGLIDAFIR